MSEIMRPVKFTALLNWVISEYRQRGSIFEIDERHFYYKQDERIYRLGNESYETLVGPAAGPHTQCAQNLISAYLTGARYFEIKTVQILDELDIAKPCIEVENEGYNTEWSTELKVEEAYREYVKAWIIIHFLKEYQEISEIKGSGIIFNMSVGYDLRGIKSPKIDKFINDLMDARDEPYFNKCLKELKDFCCKDKKLGKYQNITERISSRISNSVTLSTMHGCPPSDQEAICKYLIKEKHLNTFLKLNPTLLGYEFVQKSLDKCGFEIEIKEEVFKKDLQYYQAKRIIRKLTKEAEVAGRIFGVKLSNTLPVVNKKGKLPGEEMYMSGNALYPLTINLVARLISDMGEKLMVSYCGGAEFGNIKAIAETGMRPVTMATNLLKPGGYSRINQICRMLEDAEIPETINIAKLQELAASSLQYTVISSQKKGSIKSDRKLPLFDCITAGCVSACPISQNIPEYMRLVQEEKYMEALKVIHERNAMPHITGYICEAPCQTKCTRLDYESALSIREIKKVAAKRGHSNYLEHIVYGVASKPKVAVIGAGAAGSSASLQLRRAGFEVKVFEKEEKGGGLVRYVIPEFRLPEEAVDLDMELLMLSGIAFEYGREVNVDELFEEDYKYIVVAIGSGKSKNLELGNDDRVINALEFLRAYKDKSFDPAGYKKIAVIGGGNSAMDGARAAMRLDESEKVELIYRRTEKEMPADREEFDNAKADGVTFRPLLQPVSYSDGKLVCQPMRSGEIDESGRARPVKADEDPIEIEADLIIMAIGEEVDKEFMKKNKLKAKDNCRTNRKNVYLVGDAWRGPSSVVEAMADGITVAEEIIRSERVERNIKKTKINTDQLEDNIFKLKDERGKIKEVQEKAEFEAKRCLECDILCNKCVEVCPNRANISIQVKSRHLKDPCQIVHLDWLCNECGNCETFCPWQGNPYKDKFTLYSDEDSFYEGDADGVYLRSSHSGEVREQGQTGTFIIDDGFWAKDANGTEIYLKPVTVAMITTLSKNYGYLLELKGE